MVSRAWAACSVSRRVCSIMSRHSAIQWATTSCKQMGAVLQLSTRWQQSGSKAGLRVGTAAFQTCFWRRPSGRAAPEPALPFPRPSCSGAACLVPGDPGRSRTPVLLLITNKQHSERGKPGLFLLNNKKDHLLLYSCRLILTDTSCRWIKSF